MPVTPSHKIEFPYPHAGQITARANAKRFNMLCCGRRWYKTTLAATICIEAALNGGDYIWFAPVQDNCSEGKSEIDRCLNGYGKFNENKQKYTFPNGGTIRFVSLDNPDNARGKTAHGVILEEASLIDPIAWHEIIRPMLMTTLGWAWFIFTPKGRNWIWRDWVTSQDKADWHCMQAPTLGVKITEKGLKRSPHPLENPNIPFSEIQNAYETMSERSFRQEIMAEFVSDGGGVFRNVEEVCRLEPQAPVPGHSYVAGVDWGRVNDFTVISVWDVEEQQEVLLDRYNQIDFATQRDRIKALHAQFQFDAIIAESNTIGVPNIEELVRDGLPVEPFHTNNTSKQKIIDGLALGFEKQSIAVQNNLTAQSELQAYESHRLVSGMIRYDAPRGMHDDTVIARALGYDAISTRATPFLIAPAW